MVISLPGLLFDMMTTSIKNLLLESKLEPDNYYINLYINISVTKPSTTYSRGVNIASIDCP